MWQDSSSHNPPNERIRNVFLSSPPLACIRHESNRSSDRLERRRIITRMRLRRTHSVLCNERTKPRFVIWNELLSLSKENKRNQATCAFIEEATLRNSPVREMSRCARVAGFAIKWRNWRRAAAYIYIYIYMYIYTYIYIYFPFSRCGTAWKPSKYLVVT